MARFDKYGRVERDSIESSPNNGDFSEFIFGLIYYIIAGLIFYFYAWDEFGLGWAILYSGLWPLSVPLIWLIN